MLDFVVYFKRVVPIGLYLLDGRLQVQSSDQIDDYANFQVPPLPIRRGSKFDTYKPNRQGPTNQLRTIGSELMLWN